MPMGFHCVIEILHLRIASPDPETGIQEQRVGLVNRRSMMQMIAKQINAAADRA